MAVLSEKRQQLAVAKQVAEWTKELKHLASKIAAARGTSCAVVLIQGVDDDYTDVHPQLVLEDALRVNQHGFPRGFEFEVLNTPD
jgi:hypothetical protein